MARGSRAPGNLRLALGCGGGRAREPGALLVYDLGQAGLPRIAQRAARSDVLAVAWLTGHGVGVAACGGRDGSMCGPIDVEDLPLKRICLVAS